MKWDNAFWGALSSRENIENPAAHVLACNAVTHGKEVTAQQIKLSRSYYFLTAREGS